MPEVIQLLLEALAVILLHQEVVLTEVLAVLQAEEVQEADDNFKPTFSIKFLN